jgi:hypothetical protein
MPSAKARTRPVTMWLVDETYVKILGKWHYQYRGVDLDGQVLDCWLSATRAPAKFTPEQVCGIIALACERPDESDQSMEPP